MEICIVLFVANVRYESHVTCVSWMWLTQIITKLGYACTWAPGHLSPICEALIYSWPPSTRNHYSIPPVIYSATGSCWEALAPILKQTIAHWRRLNLKDERLNVDSRRRNVDYGKLNADKRKLNTFDGRYIFRQL